MLYQSLIVMHITLILQFIIIHVI